ncbi:MAG: uroporphyrinogen decarboxylase family protein, partial [Candidatus Poribacteria bacterium]
MGTENLSFAFYDQPKLLHEAMDFLADFFVDVTQRAVSELDIDYFNFFEDMACKSGPLISPQHFKEFMLPRYKRVIDFLHRHGIEIIWVDSDGNTEPLLLLFIEAGVTCHWPLEQAAGMDPIKIRKKYGLSLALSGGIDKRELAKDKKAIEKEVERILPF